MLLDAFGYFHGSGSFQFGAIARIALRARIAGGTTADDRRGATTEAATGEQQGYGQCALHELNYGGWGPILQTALNPDIASEVARALAEDIGSGDVTAALVPAAQRARATLITRESIVLCGTAWLDETFRQLDAAVSVHWRLRDGEEPAAGAVLCEIDGPARAILSGERCALNFVQLLSGTATMTRRYVNAIAGTGCQILDTRKTIPGLRLAQKYAVRCGGGSNHRLGLHDMVLIKENHAIAAGGIAAAIAAARRASPGVPVEVEVETLPEFRIALAAEPEVIMLDEFSRADLRAAVAERKAAGSSVRLEVSGGISLEGIRAVAQTGIDYISVGALTKHVTAADLSLRFQPL
jgi:nicotinate-nucleotide pyrophosphorylase (carboxylating)